MRLPVDSIKGNVESDEFFENSGSLYSLIYNGSALKQSTLDAIIEKFVPIDGGDFHVRQRFSEEQLKKLFGKCTMANRKVSVSFTLVKHCTKTFDSPDLVDYDKYYSEKEVLEPGRAVRFRNKDKKKLGLRMWCPFSDLVLWTWSEAIQPWSRQATP
uniref:PiggyBac transposable element-derived protein 3 n=1 Tax=Steinernema glaseri TaxID=37863 RepID=A0A1I7Z4U8_9BILA